MNKSPKLDLNKIRVINYCNEDGKEIAKLRVRGKYLKLICNIDETIELFFNEYYKNILKKYLEDRYKNKPIYDSTGIFLKPHTETIVTKKGGKYFLTSFLDLLNSEH